MQRWFKKRTNRIFERAIMHAIFIILFLLSCTSTSKKDVISDSSSYADDIPYPLQKQQDQREPETHIVEIKQMKFEPEEVKVRRGDRVLWINKDITDHDVTERAKHAWASSPLKTGQSWSLLVTESVDYFCNLHQVMKGRITVEEPPGN
jgi:plastocyanin